MSSNDSRIQPLPPDVVAKLKSSTAITHLNGVIVELVKNALDADARIIYITVDFLRGGCIVEDDGNGIPPAEFVPDGGLGKAHHTSKYHSSQDVHGRRGLFLASLSALSLLTITSHHVRHPSTNTLTFHHSTPVARLMPAPGYQELRFSAHGTSVTVNDLFGNMPVRVKSRALSLQRPDELERQWEELRHLLVSFMVANDQMAKLVVSDPHRVKRLAIYPQTRVQLRDGELDLSRIRSILAQSGLIEAQSTSVWDIVSASVADFSIHAAVSLTPSPTKKVQFVSLGSDPVFARNNANLIYTEVNRLFALSDFGTVRGSPARAVTGDGAGQSMHSKTMSKTVNKWPMFYIRINTRDVWTIDGEGQDLPESEKSLQRIIDVLSTTINEFLRQRGLRPRAGKRKRGTPRIPSATTSPRNLGAKRPLSPESAASCTEEALRHQHKLPSFRRPPNISHHFGDWTRIKSAKRDTAGTRLPLRGLESNSTRRSEKRSSALAEDRPDQEPALPSEHGGDEGSTIEPGPSGQQEPGTDKGIPTGTQEVPEVDTMVPWVDPYMGRSHLINSRTGQSILVGPSVEMAWTLRPRSAGSRAAPNRALDGIKRPKSAPLRRTENKWIETLLDNWINPVFGRPEKPINAMEASAGNEAIRPGSSSHDHRGDLCGLDSIGVSKFRGKLRKQDLKTAEVIAQVDQKFILTKMRTSSSTSLGDPASSLILIDQHAADERCRVEGLLAELFASSDSPGRIQTMPLDPIIFEIPATEASLFGRYREFFRFWGVDYTLEQGPKDANIFIFVSTLPTLIAERCRAEPQLVTDLIRGEIWRREEENGRGRPGLPTGLSDRADTNLDKGSWVDRLDGCPRGIIDLLNSRACRTAIMFNDVLDRDECQSLVRRLADCVFPFQCAHGRPSMVPILDLGAALDQTPSDEDGDEYEGLGFVDAYKRWQDGKAD
ncbi:putative DNA mismatch repair protein (Mlh3) [Aspergillus ibericus CBS 121593]|uniref:DNA mismatch repair protein n=1 Tax=Aspergillus ibericus CBS 121593 TaxID=1448316 RepID=A0A395HFH9_9EURO|nr:DNA mismatch repair protein [Aspergillus ibericus CBS 121593]RAL05748.1 DNA mismatch repair protein [Aspergillus ibericus CBS 121593]